MAGGCLLTQVVCPTKRPWYCSWVTDTARRTGSPRSPGRCSERHRSAGGRVQAICDYVHQQIAFGYEHVRYSRTAREAFCDRTGVCRNYAHLAVALCRCMTIPARYCTGYLGYIGVPATDFRSLVRSLLGGEWYTFDARDKHPAHWPGADRPRSRCGGRRDQHEFWSERAQHECKVQGNNLLGV